MIISSRVAMEDHNPEENVLLPDSQGDSEDPGSTILKEDWNHSTPISGDDKWPPSCLRKEGDKTFYRQFIRFDDIMDLMVFTVRVGDFVYLYSIIGKINSLWESPKGKHATVSLFFRPRQTEEHEKPFHGKAEVISSSITLNIPLSAIQGTVRFFFFFSPTPSNSPKIQCTVETINIFMKRKTYPETAYYNAEREFCSTKSSLTPKDFSCLDFDYSKIKITPLSTKDLPTLQPKTPKTFSLPSPEFDVFTDQMELSSTDTIPEESNLSKGSNKREKRKKPSPSPFMSSVLHNSIDNEDLSMEDAFDICLDELNDMTLPQLRKECNLLGLPSGGRKMDLISRIYAVNRAESVCLSPKKVSKKEENSRLFPSVQFGPVHEAKTKKTQKYNRVKLASSTLDDKDDTNLSWIERLERGGPTNFGIRTNMQLSPVKVVIPMLSESGNFQLREISQRMSPMKGKHVTRVGSTRKKESDISQNILDITVQQRERRTRSSACLQEEILLSSDDDLLDSTFFSPGDEKPKRRLKRIVQKKEEGKKAPPLHFSLGSSESDSDGAPPEDISGFIVDDDDEPPHKKQKVSGEEEEICYPEENVKSFIPQHLSMRAAFTVYLQYLISSCLDADFLIHLEADRESFAYFEPARKKIEHALVDKKDLIITSSVWGEDFHNHLMMYPRFVSMRAVGAQDCEACRRSNHSSSFSVVLTGKPYDSKKLWQKSSEVKFIKGQDNEVHYALGRHCHSRTWLYHRLHHAKYVMLSKIRVRMKPEEKKGNLSDVNILQIVLDDHHFCLEMYDSFTQLVQEADDFGRKGQTVSSFTS